MVIRDLALQERPREKMLSHSVASLSNAELLAIVLQSGSKDESAIQLGQRVLQMLDHGLEDLSHITLEELMTLKGVGVAKACQIMASVELGRRIGKSKRSMLGKVNSPGTVVAFFQEELRHQNKEQFIVVFLNTKHAITAYEVVSVGSLTASIVHPREVFNKAIRRSAAAILVVHNHPSGQVAPSEEDKRITQRLKEAGNLLGIRLLDHLIIADDDYYSFTEMGLI